MLSCLYQQRSRHLQLLQWPEQRTECMYLLKGYDLLHFLNQPEGFVFPGLYCSINSFFVSFSFRCSHFFNFLGGHSFFGTSIMILRNAASSRTSRPTLVFFPVYSVRKCTRSHKLQLPMESRVWICSDLALPTTKSLMDWSSPSMFVCCCPRSLWALHMCTCVRAQFQ